MVVETYDRMKRIPIYYLLFGALLMGLLARSPGVFWGYNFPTGWYGHHIDEYAHLVNTETLINPRIPPRWVHPYPKGMAAHVAVPMIGQRLIEGKIFDNPPAPSEIITLGRIINVLYGTATILIVFLLAKRLFRDRRVAYFSAWILALGGLHVTQSHFFVADVPAIFWFLLGLYLLFFELETPNRSNSIFLITAAGCFGISFGLKLIIFSLPTLALVALIYRPRFIRLIQAAVFFFAGSVLVNFASYTPYDLLKTFYKGTNDPYQFKWWTNLFLYMIELPSIVSLPVVLFFLGGSYFLGLKLIKLGVHKPSSPITLILTLPVAINILLIIFKLDHFPRHIVPLIPWISIVSAWSLVKTIDKLKSKGIRPFLVILPFFVYLGIFVYDGEKGFLKEPRNEAARWVVQNVAPGTGIFWVYHGWMPGYKHVEFPEDGKPPVLVIEMLHANHFLSGMGWKNSYPRNYRFIFDSGSQDRVDAFQALFKGTSEYKEVARFSEGYFMPEYRLVDDLIGNRSRNYLAEIVIFTKKTEHAFGS